MFESTTEKSEFKISPLTATTPSDSTFTGIVISIPRLKFVDLSVKFLPLTINKIELRTGSVKFLPVIFSTLSNEFLILSIWHSIFINVYYYLLINYYYYYVMYNVEYFLNHTIQTYSNKFYFLKC